MLSAVKAIGESIRENSESNDPIDLIIKSPKVNYKKEHHYKLGIVFNLNARKIEFNPENLSDYSQLRDHKEYLYIGVPDRQGKRYYPSFSFDKIQMLIENNIPDIKAKIEETLLNYKNNNLWKFADLFTKEFYEKGEKGKYKLKPEIFSNTFGETENIDYGKNVLQEIGISGNSEIVLIYPILEFEDKKLSLVNIEEYKELLIKALVEKSSGSTQNKSLSHCYVCKEEKETMDDTSFERSTINQIFTTTTMNYASDLNKQNYYKNFQICQQCFEDTKVAGNFIKDNLRITIAGVPSYIIPYFIRKTDVDYDIEISKTHSVAKTNFDGREFIKTADLATNINNIENFTREIEDLKNDNLPYILNFVSYDTDGNYFKIVNHIKDVPKFHFINVIESINEEHKPFIQIIKKFNLGSFYGIIPVENKNAKKNKILSLYSNILTGTRIDKKLIYKYFTEYINCQKYQRKTDNIWLYDKKYFDFAIRDSIFKYLILINALKRLNLFFEEENMNLTEEKEVLDFKEKKISKADFIRKQGFDEQQQALFYLGDILSSAASAQYKAGHESKPILNKITYQGMSVKEIEWLFNELFDKLKQYNKRFNSLNYSGESVNKFKELFDRNSKSWKLSEEQNVFYLLSGYAYNVGGNSNKKQNDASPEDNSEEIQEN